jgi:SAM-dependent methyltransferase
MPVHDESAQSRDGEPTGFYDSTYGHFDEAIYQEIRRQTWGEDIGQNGWITAAEQDRFIEWLALAPDQILLDVACGSGGPALRLAEKAQAQVVGIDINGDAISAAARQAAARALAHRASFQVANAAERLPFADGTFDAVICIDAINHFPDRSGVLAEWARVLKPGGRLVFTDPVVVSGPVSSEEIAIRSSIGFFLFVAPEKNDHLLERAGFRVLQKEDLTGALAQTGSAWHAARQHHAVALRRIEGEAAFDNQQAFLELAARVARERQLLRLAYLAARQEHAKGEDRQR